MREGRGPCIVLIPGSWGDWRVYDRVVERLPEEFQIVIVELRGHGRSQPPTLDGSIESFADDVRRVTDALRLPHYFVGGHSIGGMVAIEIAGRNPNELDGVISIEGWTHHTVVKNAFGTSPIEPSSAAKKALIAADRERVQRNLTEEQIKAFGAIWRRWNGRAILDTTPLPVLEIWGDRSAPRPTLDALQIPDRSNIELVWVANASHYLLVEDPEAVANAITTFIHRRR
ncbi:MAG: alpha/beta hydrolase [Candidatus Hydrogenedentes bacterium]|nr:alpha/beta hydrolase [Candidatus Hydrogenedentota bacterium]